MQGKKKTHAEFVSELSEVNPKIEVVGTYVNAGANMLVQCAVCSHRWTPRPYKLLEGTGCPMCARKARSSKLQRRNHILEDRGDTLLIDISINSYPDARMLVDRVVWDRYCREVGAYVRAAADHRRRYIVARYSVPVINKQRSFHHFVVGNPPKGMVVDHIHPGTKLFIDNTARNLRFCNQSQNVANVARRSTNTSGVTGVSFDKSKSKWMAYIMVAGRSITLGRFRSLDAAAAARREAEKRYFGTFAFSANNCEVVA